MVEVFVLWPTGLKANVQDSSDRWTNRPQGQMTTAVQAANAKGTVHANQGKHVGLGFERDQTQS